MDTDNLLLHKDPHRFEKRESPFEMQQVTDPDYLHFISEQSNGGFFFGQSLLVYPSLKGGEYPSIALVNKTLAASFGELFFGLASFGQDIFGKQFCFDLSSKEIISFDLEDGARKVMSSCFSDWVNVLINDYDYLTGYSYWQDWVETDNLSANQRLCPKKPFVIGGDFVKSNFYASTFPAFIELNADIAKQIHDLPDGTPVTYEIRK